MSDCPNRHVVGITLTPVPKCNEPNAISIVFGLTLLSLDDNNQPTPDTLGCFGAVADWPSFLKTNLQSGAIALSVRNGSGSIPLQVTTESIRSIDAGPIPWRSFFSANTPVGDPRRSYTTDQTNAKFFAGDKAEAAIQRRAVLIQEHILAERAQGRLATLAAPFPAPTPSPPAARSGMSASHYNATQILATAPPTLRAFDATRAPQTNELPIYITTEARKNFDQLLARCYHYPHTFLRPFGLVVDATLTTSLTPTVPGGATMIALSDSLQFASFGANVIRLSILPAVPCEVLATGQINALSAAKVVKNGYYLFAVNGTARIESRVATVDGMREDVHDELRQQDLEDADGALRLRTAGVALHDQTLPDVLEKQASNHQAFVKRVNAWISHPDRADGQSYPGSSPSSDPQIVIYSEDLLRGFRVDVAEVDPENVSATRTWRSLCMRNLAFDIPAGNMRPALHVTDRDEGWVEVGINHAKLAQDSDVVLALHDTIFRWTGWSLCAPHPGKAVPKLNDTSGDSQMMTVHREAQPRTLPTLRFGRSYDIRLRVLDIAGNGPSLDDASPDQANYIVSGHTPIAFGRHEPIAAPVATYESTGLTRAESTITMAVREPGQSTRRFLIPPQSHAKFAELHGSLDFGQRSTSGAAYDVLETHDGKGPHSPFNDTPLQYLPDPLATGIVLVFPDDFPDRIIRLPYTRGGDGNWPDRIGWWISLVGTQGRKGCKRDDAARTVYVYLPPATRVNVCIASDTDASALSLLDPYMAALLRVATEPDRVVTPSQIVTLIHAVDAPATPNPLPGIDQTPSRHTGDHTASLTLTRAPSLDDVGKAALRGHWTEYVDDPNDARGFHEERRSQPVGEITVQQNTIECTPTSTWPSLTYQQIFPDTKHRAISYALDLSSPFGAFYDNAQPPTTVALSPDPLHVPSSASPSPPNVVSVRPIVTPERTFGVPLKSVRYPHRLRIWLNRPWFSSGEGEQLAVITATPAAELSNCSRLGQDLVYQTARSTPLTLSFYRGTGTTALGSQPISAYTIVPLGVPDYDAERKRFFVDVRVGVSEGDNLTYMPFVRLALARYQPFSLPGLELSKIVTADIVQLLPGRTLTIVKNSHIGFFSISENVTISLDRTAGAFPDPPDCDHLANQFEAYIERADRDEPLLWERLAQLSADSEQQTFTGSYTLSLHDKHRITIFEYEYHPLGTDGSPGRRLVYAEAFNLS